MFVVAVLIRKVFGKVGSIPDGPLRHAFHYIANAFAHLHDIVSVVAEISYHSLLFPFTFPLSEHKTMHMILLFLYANLETTFFIISNKKMSSFLFYYRQRRRLSCFDG